MNALTSEVNCSRLRGVTAIYHSSAGTSKRAAMMPAFFRPVVLIPCPLAKLLKELYLLEDNSLSVYIDEGSAGASSSTTDSSTTGKMRFFSKDSSTIYAPRLEARWDGHIPCTGSNTGSLSELDV